MATRSPTNTRQRGSMAVPMLLMLLALVSMLGLVEVGYLYWAKRDAQKVADLAALSGAQQLTGPDCPDGSPAYNAAFGNARDNGGTNTNDSVAIRCGRQPASGSSILAPASASSVAAIKVVARRDVNHIWGKAWQSTFPVKAVAVATNSEPIAAFSVGSQLIELQDEGTVPGLLKLVGLGAGGTTLVGYNGLTNLHVTPAGLLKELGADISAATDVGTLNSILAARQVQIADLLNAMARIGEQQQLAQATLDALNTLRLQAQAQGGQLVQLGTDSLDGPRGLFALIEAANTQSALNTQVSALDLVNVGLEVANSRHFADLSVPIPGVTAWVAIIEPPSIAIGGIGAVAYTSQVRVGVDIKTSAIPVLGSLLSALGTEIKLPLILDVTNGRGELTSLCDDDEDGQTATIDTTASILSMCLGKFDKAVMSSTSQSCEAGLQDEDLVKLLGITVARGSMHLDALQGQDELVLHQGETGSVHANLDLGNAVSDLMQGLLSVILGNGITHQTSSANITSMVNDLWDSAGPQPDTPSGRKIRMQIIQNGLTKPVSAETIGLLPGLANLVGGLLDLVGNLLGGILGAVTGDGCTTTLLGFPGGNIAGCKVILNNTLGHTQQAAGNNLLSNVLLASLTQLLDVLRPVLNDVGDQLLKPLLTTLLGEQPGRTDVHLMSLQCHAGAQLVY